MSRITPAEIAPVYSDRDLVVICSLASGSTIAETARTLEISPKGVEYWLKSRPHLRQAAARVSNILRANKAQIRREAIDDYMGEIKKRDSTALAALDDALEGSDLRLRYEASREQRDRRLGAPKSSVKVEGRVDHKHTVTLPPELIAMMQQDSLRDRQLHEHAERLKISGAVLDE